MKRMEIYKHVNFPKGFIDVILRLIESAIEKKAEKTQLDFDMLHIPWHVKIVVTKKKVDPNVS